MALRNPPTLNTRWLLLFFAATTGLAFYEFRALAILYVIGFCILGWLFITIGQGLNLIRMPGAEAKLTPTTATTNFVRLAAAVIGLATGGAAVLVLYSASAKSSAQGMVLMAGWPCALFSLLCLRKAFNNPAFLTTKNWISPSGILGIVIVGWRIFLAYRLPFADPSGTPNKYFYEGIIEAALILLTVIVFNVRWKFLAGLLSSPKDMDKR